MQLAGHTERKERGAVGSKGAAVAIRLRDLIAPNVADSRRILLTSLLINEAHAI